MKYSINTKFYPYYHHYYHALLLFVPTYSCGHANFPRCSKTSLEMFLTVICLTSIYFVGFNIISSMRAVPISLSRMGPFYRCILGASAYPFTGILNLDSYLVHETLCPIKAVNGFYLSTSFEHWDSTQRAQYN